MGTKHTHTGADPQTILVVDDDRPTRVFLADNLAADGFEPVAASSLGDAIHRLRTQPVDLAVVDLGLPDGDGLELLQLIRSQDARVGSTPAQLPLMILSGRCGELHRLRGFDRGADDFIAKPFGYQELLARLRALLRRAHPRASTRIRVGRLELDSLSRQAWIAGHPVHLSAKEFSLLNALALEPTRVFTREELLRQVWGYRAAGVTRTLDTHASRVRAKLGVHGARFVVNVWGIGYRLVDVAELETP